MHPRVLSLIPAGATASPLSINKMQSRPFIGIPQGAEDTRLPLFSSLYFVLPRQCLGVSLEWGLSLAGAPCVTENMMQLLREEERHLELYK